MAIIPIRTRTRIREIGLAIVAISFVWLLQLTVMSILSLREILCNLPLTFIIVWGSIFGSPLPPITPDELRVSSLKEVFTRQVLSGSISGALLGAAFAALYASMLPMYPFSYPLAGWISGYFCLRNVNQATLMSIPFVLLMTIFAEFVMASQLFFIGRPGITEHLVHTAVPEAILNGLIAPFIYFPLRKWYAFANIHKSQGE